MGSITFSPVTAISELFMPQKFQAHSAIQATPLITALFSPVPIWWLSAPTMISGTVSRPPILTEMSCVTASAVLMPVPVPGAAIRLPPQPPPFPTVPYYQPGFSDTRPFGNSVQINPVTGLLTGIAPEEGIYVVTVCVDEIRNGRVIARQRKDIQINVAGCDIAAASLQPEYQLCGDSYSITLSNQSTSPLISTTHWEFTNTATNTLVYSSTGPLVNYTFPQAGLYRVKLAINRGFSCPDSTTALIRVFPGFKPAFTYSGICFGFPTTFTDQSSSVFGVIDNWQWDFGEAPGLQDISIQQNPVYTYPSTGTKQVSLIVADSRGCRDTLYQTLSVSDKPPVELAFRDTLICRGDQLPLAAGGGGIFTWTPLTQITGANTATPLVSPQQTTTYYVSMIQGNCSNTDSVRIRVVNEVSLQMMNDTTICQGDSIRLHVQSDALLYQWSPSTQVMNPGQQNPVVLTNQETIYQLTASIGGCSQTGSVKVTPLPYPAVNAGPDQFICFNSSTLLNGSSNADRISWSPAARVDQPGQLQTIARPAGTLNYILTAMNNRGCTKSVTDTVLITVEPKMRLQTVSDTSLVVGQPLQLAASGAATYEWSPAVNLDNAFIPDPVAVFESATAGFRYKLTGTSPAGCRDSVYLTVRVFKSGPSVFVPSGFTPNNDGLNDKLIPVLAGMKELVYFRVYNRWGQLVYSSSRSGEGWDGRINGTVPASSTFAWMIKAIDFSGKEYFSKGLSTMIR